MSKKNWSKKTLKTLFSRSHERPSGHAQTGDAQRVDEAEKKKRFTFFKMKMKTRSDQQLSRTPPEDEDVGQISSGRKLSSVFRTSSRVKLSYSESDLQKSSKFSTFSFGLGKKRRRRRDDGNLSRSVIGLQHCDQKEEESPLGLTQSENLNLTQHMEWTRTKTHFSMSQPELDSSRTFDIPSPPPLASNQTELYFTFPASLPPHSQLEPADQLEQRKLIRQGMLRVPNASIQELQLDSSGSSEVTEAWAQDPASSSSTGPRSLPDVSEVTCGVTECTSGTMSGHRMVSVTRIKSSSISSEAQNWPEVAYGSSVTPETITSSELTLQSFSHQPESLTRIKSSSISSDPETTNLSAAVGSEDQEAAHEALYRSLFPQNFNSESHPELVPVQNPSQTLRTCSSYHTWTSPEAQDSPEPHPSQLSPPLAPLPFPTQVALSSHRVALIDPPTSDPSPPPDAMDPPTDPQVLLDRPEPAMSPPYLSVGSDDSGGAELYFSAQENSEEEEEEREGGAPAPPAQQECDTAPPPADTVAVETGARQPPDLRDQFVAQEQEPEEGHAPNWGAGSAPERQDRRETDNAHTQDPGHLDRSLAPDGMSSASSSLSTSLVLPMEEESRHRACKVSLIDELQESGFGSGSSPEFRWKNRFEGVMPFRASSESSEHIAPGNTAAAGGGGVVSMPGEGGVASAESLNTCQDAQQLHGDQSPPFTGPFRATLVQLEHPPCTPPSSPLQLDMDTLVDTLRNMGPSLRPRAAVPRPPPPVISPSLPPIVEDAGGPSTPEAPHPTGTEPGDSPDGLYCLPADLGLKRNCSRDSRPPLERMKGSQDFNRSALNGNGVLLSPPTSSRLDSSVLFGSLRSTSSNPAPEKEKAYHPLLCTASLPETGLSSDRLGAGFKDTGEVDPAGSRLERLSLLITSSSSLNGTEDSRGLRMSRPPSLSVTSLTTSGSPTGLDRTPLSLFGQGPGVLERTFSGDGGPTGVLGSPLGNGKTQFQNQPPEPDRNLMSKYRAFPDAYLTKEKEHGKLNPRPGKMYIFDRPGMCGQRIEVRGDVIDATPWELQETISIRVVRGGWVLYEKPHFKGEKIALDEGDIELTCPFSSPEETAGMSNEDTEEKASRRFVIGSVRRAVRDYSVPEISLFPEENAEGKKVIFRDTSEDARIFGFPIKANSIIINAGLWLVFSQPFFQGIPRVLEVGGYSSPAAWGVEQPYVGSLHPLKVGEPRVENMTEPTIVIYEKPYFTGKSRTVTVDARDFMTRTDQQQTVFMYSVGSLKILGGIWVGYEKEGFRGHQYLLEEGEYHDWRTWGGCDAELRSARIIRADLNDPLMVLFEQPEEEEVQSEENTFEVMEAIPDVELFGFRTSTRSIHVVSGAWVAYSHVDFSGNQYILEKGFYNTCSDWGSQDPRICSVQPIRLAPREDSRTRQEVVLYSEPDFQGQRCVFDHQEAVLDQFPIRSSRVAGGSWVLYDNTNFSGNLYVLSEGDYPSPTSMGCPSSISIRSLKPVPMIFSVPSISLFGLECLEGREITMETEIPSLAQEGLNNQVLSVRVNSGWWVICEHTNYRGRQFLLEPIEITNWTKFSSLQTVGSMYPLRQKRHFFRMKNLETGQFLSIQGGVEDMKAGRVVASPDVEPLTDIWFYQDGLIKNKVAPSMSLQVMGDVQPAAKVVLWSETRQPVQTWTAQMEGLISSLTFPGVVLDVKGGKTYDRDHVVVMPENEERQSQRWQILPL